MPAIIIPRMREDLAVTPIDVFDEPLGPDCEHGKRRGVEEPPQLFDGAGLRERRRGFAFFSRVLIAMNDFHNLTGHLRTTQSIPHTSGSLTCLVARKHYNFRSLRVPKFTHPKELKTPIVRLCTPVRRIVRSSGGDLPDFEILTTSRSGDDAPRAPISSTTFSRNISTSRARSYATPSLPSEVYGRRSPSARGSPSSGARGELDPQLRGEAAGCLRWGSSSTAPRRARLSRGRRAPGLPRGSRRSQKSGLTFGSRPCPRRGTRPELTPIITSDGRR